MSENNFKAGERVRLKSGGPGMTVKAVEGQNVFTVWFEGTKHKESRFLAATLEYDDDAPAMPAIG